MVICNIYHLEFSKPTRANSIVIRDRVIMLLKKDYEGNPSKVYCAYDYKTKQYLTFGHTKEECIERLNNATDEQWSRI